MNSRVLFLLGLVYALLLAALISRSGSLAVLSLPLLVYLATGVWTVPEDIRLEAVRSVSRARLYALETLDMCLTITNRSECHLSVQLSDTILDGLHIVEGQAGRWVTLAPGKQVQLCYQLQAHRGIYAWQSVQAQICDSLGLLEIRRALPAPAEVVVQPRGEKLRRVTLRPESTLHAAGPIPAHLAGTGTDFWGVRAYQPGDSLRRIHWLQAARHTGQLYTKESEQEEIADIGLILDGRQATDLNIEGQALFESALIAAASLAEFFLHRGNRVGLLIYGAALTRVFPGYGKTQLNHIQRALAQATTGSSSILDSLRYLPVRLFPSRCQLIMISALVPGDLQAFPRLRSFGYPVLLISPDPTDFAARRLPTTPATNLALRAARLERRQQLRQIASMGVQVVDWPVDTSLGRTLQMAAYPGRPRPAA